MAKKAEGNKEDPKAKLGKGERKFLKSERADKVAKLSDGFSKLKAGKQDKKNKPSKNDDLEFEDGTVMLLDESAEVNSITGKVTFFAIEGASLKVNGKRVV